MFKLFRLKILASIKPFLAKDSFCCRGWLTDWQLKLQKTTRKIKETWEVLKKILHIILNFFKIPPVICKPFCTNNLIYVNTNFLFRRRGRAPYTVFYAPFKLYEYNSIWVRGEGLNFWSIVPGALNAKVSFASAELSAKSECCICSANAKSEFCIRSTKQKKWFFFIQSANAKSEFGIWSPQS